VFKNKLLIIKLLVFATCSVSFSAFATNVIMETPLGDIEIELFDDKDDSVEIIRLSPDVFCQAIGDAAAAN